MEKMLIIQVHFLDPRYHGVGDWPPAPARLFQALVAGCAVGDRLAQDRVDALRWLERLEAPEIRAERGLAGASHTTFVPNNDLDAKGGDPAQVANIRTAKVIQARHLSENIPVTYAWTFDDSDTALTAVKVLCKLSDGLYQLGRGVDMAWARAQVMDADQGNEYLDQTNGEMFRPGNGAGALTLQSPQRGSLDSLMLRYVAHRDRFTTVREGKKVKVQFANPPKARFRSVSYNPSHQWRLFDLMAEGQSEHRYPWPQTRVVDLAEQIRDGLKARLIQAMPEQEKALDRWLVGKGATAQDKSLRVQLIPLPSIGHDQTHRAVRRVLLRTPANCPLQFKDLEWAMSGLSIKDRTRRVVLVKAEELTMLDHYGVEGGTTSTLWQSVTPLALPGEAARRRIDPARKSTEAKGAPERRQEEQAARQAVYQALRHAGIQQTVDAVKVQREPFAARGERAEFFAHGERFKKARLWHVQLRFRKAQEGPLLLGNGRYLGLGLMAPVQQFESALSFDLLGGLSNNVNPEELAQALRRAAMARVQRRLGKGQPLPAFFTGHAQDGGPLRDGSHRHLAFIADLDRKRLLILAPHLLDQRKADRSERENIALLHAAMADLSELNAGRAGRLTLSLGRLDQQQDALFGGRVWESVTDFRPTRYRKGVSSEQVLQTDIRLELSRLGLNAQDIQVLAIKKGPRGGVSGRARVILDRPIEGPLLIGRSRHLGGGLFKQGVDMASMVAS